MSFDSASGKRIRTSVHAGTTKSGAAVPGYLRTACVLACISLAVAGCYKRSVLPQSEGHVASSAPAATLADVPQPARTSDFVPPPKPTVKIPTYSVVVNEVPV